MIYLPLGLMMLLSLVSVSYVIGIVTSDDQMVDDYSDGLRHGVRDPSFVSGGGGSYFILPDAGWVDSSGRLIVYENSSRVEGLEDGVIGYSQYGMVPIAWINATGRFTLYRAFEPGDDIPDSYGGSANTITDAKHVNDMVVAFAVGEAGFINGVLVAGIAMFFALGLNVLGSGLNSVGTKAVGSLIVFGGLWVIVSSFSVVALTGGVVQGVAVSGIPVLGWLVYLFMTFVYMIGVYQVVSSA